MGWSENQLADLMTKALGTQQFKYLVDKIGVHNIYAPSWGGVLKIEDQDEALIETSYCYYYQNLFLINDYFVKINDM